MPRPLVLTADPRLRDDLLRLAAAAGAEPDVAGDAAAAGPLWRAAPLALVGSDRIAEVAGARLPRRPGLVVVAQRPAEPFVWPTAIALGAEQVAELPDAEPWLLDRLSALGATGPRAAVVAVVGARGGAGATTFAVSYALAAARTGRRTMLVDVDPYGGGIDLALGAEHTEGPRWHDVASSAANPAPAATPRVPAEALTAALPRCGEVTVLAWSRDSPATIPAAVVESILAAARRETDLVVLDVPRTFGDAARAALATADVAYVVCPAEVRACASGRRVAATVTALVDDVRAVVRGPAGTDLDAGVVASVLGLPLAGWLDPEPGIDKAYDRGRPPGRAGRGPLARLCRDLLADLDRARDAAEVPR
jgi:secretion/DNA translocation related CpaE-like protein